eukprot:scaffold14295_cov161-Skeletonema_marinoi.AAC.11
MELSDSFNDFMPVVVVAVVMLLSSLITIINTNILYPAGHAFQWRERMMHLLSLDSLISKPKQRHSNGSGVGTYYVLKCLSASSRRYNRIELIPAGRNSVGHGVTLFKNDDQTQK